MSFANREDDLAATAIMLVADIRTDPPAVHRALAAMSHLELRQVACVLAAMAPDDAQFNQIAWWRLRAVDQQSTQHQEEAA